MEDNNERRPPAAMISQEGPLRSVTTPPFAGPMAFRNFGSFAQNQSPTILAQEVGSTPPHPSTGVQDGSSQAALRPSPPTAALRSSPTDRLSSSQSTQQPFAPSVQQQQPTGAFGSLGGMAAHQGTPAFQAAPPQATAGSDAQDLFARPAPPPPSSASDPLSHLLQTTQGGGREVAQGGPTSDVSNPGAYNHGSSAKRHPTDSLGTPQHARWSFPAAGGAGDAFRDAVVSSAVPAPAPFPPRAQEMPALPPPPQALSHTTTPPNYHQRNQNQQGIPLAAQPQSQITTPAAPPLATVPKQASQSFTPPQERSLDDLVSEFLSNSAPAPPEATDQDSAMADPQGWVAALGRLARRRAWSTLVDVAGTMLVVHRGGGAPGLTAEQAMNVRLRRALGLLRLGRGAEAVEAATEAREEGRQTKLAPVSVAARLAAAGAKATCGGAAENQAVDELTTLKSELEELIAAAAATATPPSQPAPDGHSGRSLPLSASEGIMWRRRVMSTLANVFVSRGNWRLALGLLESMGKEACAHSTELESGGASEAHVRGNENGSACRVEVLSRIGRVFLQFGALKDAEVYFRRAEEALPLELESGDRGHVGDNSRILVNRGLLLLSKNDFVSAQENFEKAASAAEAALSAKQALRQTDDDWDWATSGEGTILVGSALNNLSLAMVYSCDVMRGVQTLEGLIRKNPRLYMLDVVVFNLCTLYDLSFDAVASVNKKRILQAVGQRFRLEDIDPASFRIS